MDFKKLASELFDNFCLLNSDERRYRALFGASLCVTCLLWTIVYLKLQPKKLP